MAPNPSVSARWQLGKLGGHSVSEAANQARSVCVKLIQIVLQWNVKNVHKKLVLLLLVSVEFIIHQDIENFERY